MSLPRSLRPSVRPAPRRHWLVVAPARALGAGARDDLTVHVQWPRLTADLIARLAPDAVVAPLMTPAWDVCDLAAHLLALGYRGRVLIDCAPLPRPGMVLAEVQALVPGLPIAFLAA